MNRTFIAQKWDNIIKYRLWREAVEEATDLIDLSIETDIQGYDIDEDVLKTARINAENEGVSKLIHFQSRDVSQLRHSKKYGFIITNPHMVKEWKKKKLYLVYMVHWGSNLPKLDSWSAYVITSYQDIEKYMGRKSR